MAQASAADVCVADDDTLVLTAAADDSSLFARLRHTRSHWLIARLCIACVDGYVFIVRRLAQLSTSAAAALLSAVTLQTIPFPQLPGTQEGTSRVLFVLYE